MGGPRIPPGIRGVGGRESRSFCPSLASGPEASVSTAFTWTPCQVSASLLLLFSRIPQENGVLLVVRFFGFSFIHVTCLFLGGPPTWAFGFSFRFPLPRLSVSLFVWPTSLAEPHWIWRSHPAIWALGRDSVEPQRPPQAVVVKPS